MLRRRPPDPLFALRGHTSSISCLCEDDSCRFLLSGTQTGDVAIWDLQTRRQTSYRTGFHPDGIIQTGYLKENKAFTHGKEGRIQIIDISTGLDSVIATHTCGSLTFCKANVADGDEKSSLFVPMEDDTIGVLSLKDQSIIPFFPKQKSMGMVMTCNGSLMNDCIVGYESGHVCVYDCRTRSCRSEIKVFGSPILDLATSSDLSSFVCGSSLNELAFCHKDDQTVDIMHTTNNGNLSLSLRGDDRLLAVGGKDGNLRLFDYRKRRPLAILSNHHLPIHCVYFAKDFSFASGGDDRTIMIWNVYQHGNR